MIYFIDKTSQPYRGTTTRAPDLEILQESLSDQDPAVRRSAAKAIHNLKNEDSQKVSMRESLIKAHREQNHEEIKDIHDYVGGHKKYQND